MITTIIYSVYKKYWISFYFKVLYIIKFSLNIIYGRFKRDLKKGDYY